MYPPIPLDPELGDRCIPVAELSRHELLVVNAYDRPSLRRGDCKVECLL